MIPDPILRPSGGTSPVIPPGGPVFSIVENPKIVIARSAARPEAIFNSP